MENSTQESGKNSNRNFNWALFLGCCVIALGISVAGGRIANQIPHVMHGNFSGSFMSGTGHVQESEFMSEWQAASFLMLNQDEFSELIQSGALSGTYTVFQVERRVWQWIDEALWWQRVDDVTLYRPSPRPHVSPIPTEYDIILVDHRVFSRERLTEWLINRIDNN